jgi:hypothetical protein
VCRTAWERHTPPGAINSDGLDRVRQVRRRRLGDSLEPSNPPDGVGSKMSELYVVAKILSTVRNAVFSSAIGYRLSTLSAPSQGRDIVRGESSAKAVAPAASRGVDNTGAQARREP